MTYSTYEPFMAVYPGGLIVPTAVGMKSLRAHAGESSVLLDWTTAHEINNAGFHLHRSVSRQGPYTRINPSLIPGQGYSTRGARYQFSDEHVEAGVTYYYKLQDVDFRGHGAGLQESFPRFCGKRRLLPDNSSFRRDQVAGYSHG